MAAAAVDLDDGDADPARRRAGGASAGRAGPAERVPAGRSGRSSWNQTCLCVGGVLDAPAGGQRGAQQQAAAALAVGVADAGGRRPGAGSRARGSGRRPRSRTPSSLRRHSTSAAVPACTTALVTSSLVRTTASSTMSAKPQPWRVSRTKARAVATERPTGSKVAAARAVITGLLMRCRRMSPVWLVRAAVPSSAAVRAVPRISPVSWCGAPPIPLAPCHRPAGRTGVAGQPHARLLTFAVRADAGHECFRPDRALGRCAKLPNCYGLVQPG